MLDFESARRRFVATAQRSGSERITLLQAVGRVLAEPLHATRPVPEFDTSAMDGYALRVEDIAGLPYALPVEGEAPAGFAPQQLRRGTAMRIFTGAAVPEGANAVVMQEHVERDGELIRGNRAVSSGQNVRRRGEDMAEGALALDRGQRLHPAAMALVSFLDRAQIEVSQSPRIVILCTGSELRVAGTASRAGSIVESNSLSILGLAQQAGASVMRAELVQDDAVAVAHAIERSIADADVLVTIGGVSVGDYDFVRPALEATGFDLELYQVGIKPGKPITLGRRHGKVVVGLPGNPASAIVTFAIFAMPLLRTMQGDAQPMPLPIWVPLLFDVPRAAKRTRVVLGNLASAGDRSGFIAHPNQTSGATIALGQTTGFVILDAGTEPVVTGTPVPFHRWTDL